MLLRYGMGRGAIEAVLAGSEPEQLEMLAVMSYELGMMQAQAEEEYAVAVVGLLLRVGAAFSSVYAFEEATDHHVTDHVSDSYNIYKLEKEVQKALEAKKDSSLTEQERSAAIHTHLHKAHQHNEKLRVRTKRPKKHINDLDIDELKKLSGGSQLF